METDCSQTAVAVYHWAASRLSSNWVEPLEYKPERFLGDEKYADDKKEAFKPFSTGPRDCVGKK